MQSTKIPKTPLNALRRAGGPLLLALLVMLVASGCGSSLPVSGAGATTAPAIAPQATATQAPSATVPPANTHTPVRAINTATHEANLDANTGSTPTAHAENVSGHNAAAEVWASLEAQMDVETARIHYVLTRTNWPVAPAQDWLPPTPLPSPTITGPGRAVVTDTIDFAWVYPNRLYTHSTSEWPTPQPSTTPISSDDLPSREYETIRIADDEYSRPLDPAKPHTWTKRANSLKGKTLADVAFSSFRFAHSETDWKGLAYVGTEFLKGEQMAVYRYQGRDEYNYSFTETVWVSLADGLPKKAVSDNFFPIYEPHDKYPSRWTREVQTLDFFDYNTDIEIEPPEIPTPAASPTP